VPAPTVPSCIVQRSVFSVTASPSGFPRHVGAVSPQVFGGGCAPCRRGVLMRQDAVAYHKESVTRQSRRWMPRGHPPGSRGHTGFPTLGPRGSPISQTRRVAANDRDESREAGPAVGTQGIPRNREVVSVTRLGSGGCFSRASVRPVGTRTFAHLRKIVPVTSWAPVDASPGHRSGQWAHGCSLTAARA